MELQELQGSMVLLSWISWIKIKWVAYSLPSRYYLQWIKVAYTIKYFIYEKSLDIKFLPIQARFPITFLVIALSYLLSISKLMKSILIIINVPHERSYSVSYSNSPNFIVKNSTPPKSKVKHENFIENCCQKWHASGL